MLTLTLSVVGAVPFVGAIVSHGWLLVEVNVSVPVPELLMLRVRGEGFPAPVVAENDSEDGATPRMGAGLSAVVA
jgi:hypothetical protein